MYLLPNVFCKHYLGQATNSESLIPNTKYLINHSPFHRIDEVLVVCYPNLVKTNFVHPFSMRHP